MCSTPRRAKASPTWVKWVVLTLPPAFGFSKAHDARSVWNASGNRRRVVDHLDERLLRLRHQGKPGMAAAVQMQHLPESGPSLPPATVTSPRAAPLHQTRPLQDLLHAAVRQLHPVLPPHRRAEVPGVEARVALPVQPKNPLHLLNRGPARRGTASPHVHQPLVAELLHALPKPPQTPRRDPQNLRRLKPAVLLVHRPKEHFLDCRFSAPLTRAFSEGLTRHLGRVTTFYLP
jgi:hypothetical protein